jgi:TonB family protein
MLKALTLTSFALLALGCSTAQTDPLSAETEPVTEVAHETNPEPDRLPTGNVAALERGVLNVAVENWSQPTYPDEAREKGIEGVVLVRVNVEQDGRVSRAKAESGHPLLTDAAEEWARGRRIIPHRVAGETVNSSGILAVKFGH